MITAWVLVATLLISSNANATNFMDLKFGQYQVADTQWNVNSCLNTNSCQIYSKNPGIAYKIPWYTGQVPWQPGGYIKFTPSNQYNNPWQADYFNAQGGWVTTLGQGKVVNLGTDANGVAYFFFVGSDNNTGQLFSMSEGMSSTAGVTFTGTQNPDTNQLNTYSAQYGSEQPLAAGESSTPSQSPTCGGSSDSSVTCDQTSQSDLQYYSNHSQRKQDWENIDTGTENIVRIDQIGDYNIIQISQHQGFGTGGNLIQGQATTSDTATMNGDSNYLGVIQNGNDNVVGLDMNGDRNSLSVIQSGNGMRNRNIIEGNDNYVFVYQGGNFNQDAGKGNFADVKQSGDGNFASVYQHDENQLLVLDVEADNTLINTDQRDGENYASMVIGNDYTSASIQQKGGGDHGANVYLTGSDPVNLGITQDSSTGQLVDVTNHCVTTGGCTITITQD